MNQVFTKQKAHIFYGQGQAAINHSSEDWLLLQTDKETGDSLWR
jgi:hypothetical protein